MPAVAEEPGDETGPFAAGKKVFAANNCTRCHAMGGPPPGMSGPGMGGPPPGKGGAPPEGGPPGMGGGPGGRMMGNRGPSLAKAGADPTHTVDWLMAHIRNAKTHKPQSRMPPFEGKINDTDLRALADYLASLK